MIYLIDAAAVLNSQGFSFASEGNFVTVPAVVDEFRDLRSRSLAENALKNKLLKLREPTVSSLKQVKELARQKGFSKMSKTDISLLALALDLKAEKEEFVLVSDDYSVQNFCKLFEIEFDSVIRGKISGTVSFSKKCVGCGKVFPNEFKKGKCPNCGAPVKSKRT